ncbi:MAG: FAD-dependent oxidoreductase [Verrucomicrobiota bacterium]
MKRLITLITFFTLLRAPASPPETTHSHDIVIYGGTCAAVTAAVQAKRLGKSVVIVSPDKHLGGLSSGGLGWTDTGNKSVIGGLAREFYHRVYKHYQTDNAWPWQSREGYGNRAQGHRASNNDKRTMWVFEPHVAEKIFEDLVAEFDIEVHRDEWLNREHGVSLDDNNRITTITTLDGKTFAGKYFLDTTYEGDLLAAAGVEYHVGREANHVYNENWNGVQTGVLHHFHHFDVLDERVDPYRTPGDPASGLLPRISPDPPGDYGEGDHRVQAYCFRMCLTDHPENRIPFTKPDGYDPDQYELLLRCFDAGWDKRLFNKFDPLPNRKTDTNNHGPFSTDNIGFNYDYPEASYEERQAIIDEHETYQKGWLYFLTTDPRVPQDVQQEINRWGLAKDEFKDTGGWPHQLYIREARRMIGDYVMTENELLKRKDTPDPVGMGSYTIDSHNVQRYVTPDGYVQNEGDIGVKTDGPYKIAYGALTPKRTQCQNLLVPVCVSSSHIAFGSIRMEPVFMILGESAATAASLAIDAGDIPVQDLPYKTLRTQLLRDGQILETPEGAIVNGGLAKNTLDGVVFDDEEAAERTGLWKSSRSNKPFLASGYLHDNNTSKGQTSITFKVRLEEPGDYKVRVLYPKNANRASNANLEISHDGPDRHAVTLNQRKEPSWLGPFALEGDAIFQIQNDNTDGYVVIDGLQLVKQN